MYKIYLDGMLLPMGTDKIETTISDRNDEVELIDGEVISVVKAPGLTTWKFTTLVPPTQIYGGAYDSVSTTSTSKVIITANDVLDKLEDLKLNKKAFQFIVIRNDTLNDTNITVTLQDYKRTESSDNATLSEIEINLREYRAHQNTSIEIELPEKPEIMDDIYLQYADEIKRLEDMNPPKYYTVKVGFSSWAITPPGMPGMPGSPIVSVKIPSWFEIGKELFGDQKYGYGIRNTNNLHWNTGEDENFSTRKFPGAKYPEPNSKLTIDVPNIVLQTNLVMQSPPNMR